MGNGAVFFDLYNASRLEGRRATLVDDNADLIGCYHALRDRTEEVIAYCDPPYAPLSPTASFAQYTAQGFSALDQLRLQRAVTRAAKRGASVVVSNSSAPEIEALHGSVQAQRAGLMIRRVEARPGDQRAGRRPRRDCRAEHQQRAAWRAARNPS